MFYIDNSETSWLVYADWLEDQDIDATHIRTLVVNPTTNEWWYEHNKTGVGGTCVGGVGSACYHYKVGTFDSYFRVGVAFNCTDKVGGNL